MMPFLTIPAQNRLQLFALILAVACLGLVIIINAWVCDDAYITFRTIDNFVHGYGLRWNIDERVQTYTHPLWLMVLTIPYAITREPYYTSLTLSIILSLLTGFTLIFLIARSYSVALLGAGALILSKAFIDYSTSGLENSLSHFLAVLLCWYVLRRKNISLTLLTLLISLSALNRLDTVLIFTPILLWHIWKQRSWPVVGKVMIGLTPLVAWELFSLFYYGFLVPNTAVAKLNVDIGHFDLLQQGIYYLQDSLWRDPVTLFVSMVAAVVIIAQRNIKAQLLQAGVLLYLFYIIWIGGDFMSGRFLSVPFVISVAVLVSSRFLLKKYVSIFLSALVLLLGLSVPQAPVYSNALYSTTIHEIHRAHGIADERGYYYPTTGLLAVRNSGEPLHPWVQEGKDARNKKVVAIRRSIGFFGYYAGPTVHVIDLYALGDPLLARLPHLSRRYTDEATLTYWRVGHFRRGVPPGYVETVQSRENKIKNPDIAAYYNLLSSATHGPLWSTDRLKAIWKLNTGAQHSLDTYQDEEKKYFKDNEQYPYD